MMQSEPGVRHGWRRVEALVLWLLLLAPLVFDPWGNNLSAQFKANYLNIAAGLLVTAFLFRSFFKIGFRFMPSPADAVWLLFMLFAGTSYFWSANHPVHLQRLTLLGAATVAYFMIRVRLAEGDEPAKYVLFILAVGTLVALVDSAGILLAGNGGAGPAGGGAVDPAFKTGSILFPHYNVASIYIIILVPLGYAMIFSLERMWRKVLCGAALAVLVGYLVLLESRAALLEALLVLLVITLCVLFRKRMVPTFRFLESCLKRRTVLILLVGLFLLLFLLPLSREFSSWAKAGFSQTVNFFGLDYTRSFFRLDIWRKTMAMIADHIWLGVGLGNFPVIFPAYHKAELLKPHPHSEYFNILAELGVVGMVLYVVFLVMLFKAFIRCFLAEGRSPAMPILTIGLGCALLVEGLHGFFEPPMVFEASMLNIMVCSGLLVGLEARVQGVRCRDLAPGGWIRRRLVPLLALAGFLLLLPRFALSFTQSPDLVRAREAFREQRFDEAEELYRRISERNWESYYFHLLLGDIGFYEGKFEKAMEEYERSEALFPYYFLIHYKKGCLLNRLGRSREAVEALDRCLEYNPRYVYASFEKAQALFMLKRYDEAFSTLEGYMRSKEPTEGELRKAGRMYLERAMEDKEYMRAQRLPDLKQAQRLLELAAEKRGEPPDPQLERQINHIAYLIKTIERDLGSKPLQEKQ